MGNETSLIDEFEFLLEPDIPENTSTYLEDSQANIDKLLNSLGNYSDNSKASYQGIYIKDIKQCINYEDTDTVPWKHCSFIMDFSKLKSINKEAVLELCIPEGIEELMPCAKSDDTEFMFKQTFRNKLQALELPNSLLIIDADTFAFYRDLKYLIFKQGSSLVKIGTRAFANCENLTKLDLRNCLMLDTIDEDALKYSSIKTLKISSSMRSLKPLNCESLRKVVVDSKSYDIDTFNSLLRDSNLQSVDDSENVFWYNDKM